MEGLGGQDTDGRKTSRPFLSGAKATFIPTTSQQVFVFQPQPALAEPRQDC